MLRIPFFLVVVVLAGSLVGGCSSRPKSSVGMTFELAPPRSADTNNAVFVLQINGDARWQESPGSPSQRLVVGAYLPSGAVISTDGDADVELLLPRGSGTLTLEGGTRVVLMDDTVGDLIEIFVADGRVSGSLAKDSLRLFNGCGASLQITPQVGMTSPFSFGNTLPDELWDAMISLGLNPDVLLPPLRSEHGLWRTPDTFVAPYPTDVPEPSAAGLAVLGLAGWAVSRAWRRG